MKRLVIGGDLYIFLHYMDRYISHTKPIKECPSFIGFAYFVKQLQSRQVS